MASDSPSPASPVYRLRSCRVEDYEFLWRLKQSTMRRYVEQTWGRWDEDEQEGFFRRGFVPESLKIVTVGSQDAGLLSVVRPPGEIFLADIEILPELQGRGVGAAVIRDLQAEAESNRLPLRLQVLRVNHAARRLYERLGFQLAGGTDTHHFMLYRG